MTSKGQNLVDMLLVSKLVSEADICPVSDKESACTHVQIARQNTMLTCGNHLSHSNKEGILAN